MSARRRQRHLDQARVRRSARVERALLFVKRYCIDGVSRAAHAGYACSSTCALYRYTGALGR